ncbi:hypothetical protein BU17DRAFT_92292 [Hysterangium stoloniferum]|nr:hypothetical protein BU17DRAFT_92292 [Hysterangium stoloniferum]
MKSQSLRRLLLSAVVHRSYSTKISLEQLSQTSATVFPPGFTFLPHFLNDAEQRILLQAALQKLNEVGSREFKRKRKSISTNHEAVENINNLFLPDNYYEFEEGHYDGVITEYRETHVTLWPHNSLLEPILHRIYTLLPCAKNDIQTHLLHLASEGMILPHVDNVDASGSWIAGISLGGERVLRLENEAGDMFELLLLSGSAYVQSDNVRFSYKHSILPGGGIFKGVPVATSQRLSVMLRDKHRTGL